MTESLNTIMTASGCRYERRDGTFIAEAAYVGQSRDRQFAFRPSNHFYDSTGKHSPLNSEVVVASLETCDWLALALSAESRALGEREIEA